MDYRLNPNPLPSVDKILRAFTYCPSTGVFTHHPSARSHHAGRVAGVIDRYGYRKLTIKRKEYKAHRLAWKLIHGVDPSHEVDHINGDKDDNSAGNLRAAIRIDNAHNTGLFRNNTSGHKGVSWDKRLGLWCGRVSHKGKVAFRFHHASIEDVVAKLMEARSKLHGEYSNHGA